MGSASGSAATGLLIALPGAVDFGTVAVGQKAASTVTFINKSADPIEISQLSLTGQSFSASSQSNLPYTLAAGSTIKMTVEFVPVASGDAQGQLSVTTSVSKAPAAVVSLKGKGAVAGAPILSIKSTKLSFGDVPLNTPSTQSITMTSTGSVPVTISSATISGAGFTVSGSTFPVTLKSNQSLKLNVQFDPAVAGTVAGQLTITSDASTNGTAVIDLSGTGTTTAAGTGTPTLGIDKTSLSFGDVAVKVPSTQPITLTSAGTSSVTISAATITGAGFSVSGTTFPITLNPGKSATVNVQFDPTVTGAVTGQLTISSNSFANSTAVISLSGTGTTTAAGTGTPTLSINATSLPFGDVTVGVPSTQPITLTSTGTSSVTISAATITGAGFSVSGTTFPITLNPGQSATVNVQLDPTVAGAVTGQLTISSNSSTSGTAVISLSGTGVTHEVDLSWNAPSTSADPVSGYNVYRAPSGSGAYQVVSSTGITQTTYMDLTIQSGMSYDYVVKSFDAAGVESSPSNSTSVTIP